MNTTPQGSAAWHDHAPNLRPFLGNFPQFFEKMLLLPLLFAAGNLFSQTTWDGSDGTDWDDPDNWSTGIVPTAADNVVIPNAGDTPNDPTISTAAVAKSVKVNSGGVLTIAAAGSLTISGSFLPFGSLTISLLNQGTVHNNGILTIGSTTNTRGIGIENSGTFHNNTGGQINIDRTISNGIENDEGTFNNAATITLGAVASVGPWGIDNLGNAAIFNNNTGGQINIDRTTFGGILNNLGTFTNAATITIGATQSIGLTGIQNSAIFNNNTGGQINIDRADLYGIDNGTGGNFTNAATITIGAINVAATIDEGLRNSATFHNNAGGQININRTIAYGLGIAGTFTNEATITIGANASVGIIGLYLNSGATFNNNVGGQINIDRANANGLRNAGTFTNEATITIGAINVTATIDEGLHNSAIFNNNTGGQINIDRTTAYGLRNAGTFTNQATITIGAVASVGTNGIRNEATFSNQACGEITTFYPLNNLSSITNAGLFRVNTATAHANSGTVTNDGIIEYPLGNPISGTVTNNEIIAAPISGCGTTTVSPALSLSAVDFSIATNWFLDENLTSPAGTFNAATNTFTNTNVPTGTQTTVYFSINDGTGGCARTVSVEMTLNAVPTAYAVTGGGTFCASGMGLPVGLADSETGVNYQLLKDGANEGSPVAGTGSALNFGLKNSPGLYTVLASTATGGCTATMTGSANLTSTACTPFITTWKTDNTGTSNSTSITIPTTGTGYNYEVDWNNDGVFDQSGITGSVTHDFGTAGTYTIRIQGNFPRIYFNNAGDRQKLLDISQWGSIAWTSMASAFYGCSNLDITATDVPNLSGVTSMENMFRICTMLNGPSNIDAWNTAAVTNMTSMFQNADAFNQPIGNWNTAAVTNMAAMFRNADAFNQPIGNWNTAAVTNMYFMFEEAYAFNQPIGTWNTAEVISMTSMFSGADAFNQPLGNWTLNASVSMSSMLSNCGMDCANYSATLNGWYANPLTPNGLLLGATGRLYESAADAARTNLDDAKNWTITGDALVSTIFYADADGDGFGNLNAPQNACAAGNGLVANSTDCNDAIAAINPNATEICNGIDDNCDGQIDEGNVCGMPFITTWKTDNPGTSNSTSITIPTTGTGYNYEVDWDNDGVFDQSGITGNVTHDFGTAGTYTIRIQGNFPRIFFDFGGDKLKLLDISQWGNIAWTSFGRAFLGCSNLNITATDVPNLSGVTAMDFMFASCSSLNGPANIGTWNTAAVTNMSSMFLNATAFNQPIGNWNTAAVSGMSSMFNGATAFNQPIGTWNTAAVTNMAQMFQGAAAFNQPIGTWNTAAVTSMFGMFIGATAFNQPIGTWNTAAVTKMTGMFSGAAAFNQPIGTWNTAAVSGMSSMFNGATAFNQPLGNWTLNASVLMGNMLDNCGMDCANYSATLIGWSNNSATPNGLTLGANGRTYETAAVAARTNLDVAKNWTFLDDALVSTIFYADADGDGFGNAAVSQNACSQPSGYVTDFTDCNDSPTGGAAINPNATETCNGIDDNCNTTIDDVAACPSAGTRTWTGFVNSDWNTPCNWNPACVPTADDDVVIPDVTNAPTISTAALAKSVIVNTDGVLTIEAAGSLTVNGSTTFGSSTVAFVNEGTVQNNGTLTIGSTTVSGQYGIRNEATFNNNTGGQINIDRATFGGILNHGGTFTNAATITIGALNVTATMQYGIFNQATFNNTGGQISIDRTHSIGLYNLSNFTNAATITIGAVNIAATIDFGIYNSSTFNNNTGGQISIDRTTATGLANDSGTFTNAATIAIGAVASAGTRGIHNANATFNNNTGGQINIDRVSLRGIENNIGSNFTNVATITIGFVNVTATIGSGILNRATFSNNTGGQINIDRTTTVGLENSAGTFTNAATIAIGANASVGADCITNATTFNNNAGGQIHLDNSTLSGIWNHSDGTFANAASITIGATWAVGHYGIDNSATFSNNTDGQINIDQTTTIGLLNFAGTFTNAASITIGALASIGQFGISNSAPFNNQACGQITTFYPLSNTSSITNAGLFRVNTASAHTNSGTLTNNGIIEYPLGNPISGTLTNNEIIAAPVSDGCIVSPALSLGLTVDFTIATDWFLDENLTSLAGTFDAATNTFSNSNVPLNTPTVVYFTINDGTGGCERTVSIEMTINSATEICDGLDNDCDTQIDEGVQNEYFADADGDGHGNAAVSQMACSQPTGYVTSSDDCDDTNAARFPTNPEICDGLDNDCENGIPASEADGDSDGYMVCENDCDDSEAAINPGASETCNYIDDDCDGTVDDNVTVTRYYYDADGDTFGESAAYFDACAPSGFYTALVAGDCDNDNAAINPDATEICNNVDDNCNGTADDVACSASAGTRTWTGLIDTDWSTPCNWNPACVPTADDDVIIPDVTNDPTIDAAAVAKTVIKYSGSLLTVAAAGSLTVNGSTLFPSPNYPTETTAFVNRGTVDNNGTITIGSTTSSGKVGLWNKGIFNNNTGAEIHVDHATESGIYNNEGSTFTNAASITIGAIASVGNFGLWNDDIFNNNTGGEIHVDRATLTGVYNLLATFNNAASITIGAIESPGSYGIYHQGGTFNNNTGGEIHIDRSTTMGVNNFSGTFNNSASITIGANAATTSMDYGIWSKTAFNNNMGAEIHIDRSTVNGLLNNVGGTFNNAGEITLGANASVGTGIKNQATFSNNACGEITTFYPLENTSSFTNAGLFRVNTATAHANSGTVTNDGIIEYPLGNPIPNVTNNEIIAAPISTNCSVSPALSLGSTVDFSIGTDWFLDENLTSPAGTFNPTTSTFSNSNVPLDVQTTVYFSINDGAGGCARTVSIEMTINSATEICNGVDDDCDGDIDEGFPDTDTDGMPDCLDNCPTTFNPGQEDADMNGIGDACDCAGVIVEITGDEEYCATPGNIVTLTASISTTADTYLWEDNSTDATRDVNPIGATTYSVTITDTDGCSATAEFTVTGLLPPTPTISGINSICYGQSTTLTAGGGTDYEWSTGDMDSQIETGILTESTPYTVTITAANGCTVSAIKTVFIKNLPVVNITGNTTLCEGQNTKLTATLFNSTYLWNPTGATTSTITVAPLETTVYNLTITSNVTGCSNTGSVTVNLTGPCTCEANNLFTNSGFENGKTEWSATGSIAVISSPPADIHGGAKALRMCNSSGSGFQRKAALPQQSYVFSGWAKGSGANSKFVGVQFLGANQSVLQETNQSIYNSSYEQFSLTVTAPEGTKWIKARFVNSAGSGCLFVDDFCLVQTVLPMDKNSGQPATNLFAEQSEVSPNLEQFSNPPTFDETGLQIFPNPAAQVLNLNFSNQDEAVAGQVEIFNSMGQRVLTRSLRVEAGETGSLNIGHLPEGNYFLVFISAQERDNGSTTNERFVIFRG